MSKLTWQISNVRVLIQTQIWAVPKLFPTVLSLNSKAVLEADLGQEEQGRDPVCASQTNQSLFSENKQMGARSPNLF